MRSVSVFGSTGSVGQNTVDLLLRQGDAVSVEVLSGGRNIDLLANQARKLRARHAVVAFDDGLSDLRAALSDTDTVVSAGPNALQSAAARPVDWVLNGIVGFAGLDVSLTCARNAKVLALANKESLVCGAGIVQRTCADHQTTLLPVDSEHSAIFQCIAGNDAEVERIILTASGGPFRNASRDQMAKATPDAAAAHPNWSMGLRISIDSASLFNKAMELIETYEYFNVAPDQVEVIIHPQSIIHSIVGFQDGALLAHLGPPDMRAPIGFALNWPHRCDLPVERLDFGALGALSFSHPDDTRFPALRLARDTLALGGAAGAVFNGAKEAALDRFLAREIGFLDMADRVEIALSECSDLCSDPTPDIAAIHHADAAARASVYA